MRRTKIENETIINFNEAEDTAQIYTFNAALKQFFLKAASKTVSACEKE